VAFIGFFIIKYVEKALAAFFKKANFDEVLERFVQSFLVIVAKITLLGVVISILGVEASSFVAVFGAMVFAVGMALQGSLSNFAGGVLILIFKPFKLGDFIKTEGESGTVIDMQIFNTILKRSDGVKVILPNGAVSNGTIINSTDIEEKRIDFIIGIGYGDSIKKAREVLEKVAAKDDRILKEKGVHVSVNNLGDNSVDILFRV
jgi:small conductance mechanosensitive channel